MVVFQPVTLKIYGLGENSSGILGYDWKRPEFGRVIITFK